MPESIKAIMEPRSIAVIGATDRRASVGRAVVTNIIEGGYTGVLYPVNPRAEAVVCNRAYASVKDIPGPVDMAVVIVPAPIVKDVVAEAAEKGVKGVVIISAGFKETGGEGKEREEELKAIAKEHGIRLVGPNCLGVINTARDFSMNASFAQTMPRPGNIGFISQSGALCTAVLDVAAGRHIGFSKFVSFGNKADINEIELLEYMGEDPETDVILMYLEDISDGRRFMEVASRVTWKNHKPVLAIKSGRSEAGARAVSSHTGSLAGSDAAYDAIFFQSGIQRVEDINEMFHYAEAFSRAPMPRGKRLAIVTNAGGPGIMSTDAAVRHGLTPAVFSEKTKQTLRENLPATAAINNPVDVIGDADYQRYEVALKAVLDDENVDGCIVVLTPQKMTDVLETAEIVPKVAKKSDTPVLCAFMGIVDVSEGVRYLSEHGVPNYAFPEEAVRAFASMGRFAETLSRATLKKGFVTYDVEDDRVAEIIAEKLAPDDHVHLPQSEAAEILDIYGFPLLKGRMITSEDQVEQALKEVGPPVAMKVSSPDVVHKFDAGGVFLKVRTSEEARQAYQRIHENVKKAVPDARINGVLMEQMASGGTEVIIGAHHDPSFGPMVMFGLGGTFVETLKDVTFRLAPMREISAERMIQSVRAYKILEGVRGQPPADTGAIKDCIMRLSQLVTRHPQISELDINPLIVLPKGQGAVVADSRIILKKT